MTEVDTKDLRTTMMGKIIQLDYDWILAQNGCCSYCLTDAQVQMVLSIMDYFKWSTRWYSTSGKVDTDVIEGLAAGLGEALMSGCGCGDDLTTLTRMTPDGHWQTSTDGETWQNASQEDPRRAVPLRPQYPDASGGDAAKCQWADSIVNVIKVQFVEILTNEMTLKDVLAALGALLTLILSLGGVVSVLVGLTALPAIIIGVGVLAMQAAFTSEVWDRLRCNIYENMDSAGIGTQDQVDAIYARIAVDETGIAVIVLQGIIALFGVQGVINAANAGFGAADAECNCNETCATEWQAHTPDAPYTTLTVINDGLTLRASVVPYDGTNSALTIYTTDQSGCHIAAIRDISGTIPNSSGWGVCDYPNDNRNFSNYVAQGLGHACVNGIAFLSTGAFVVEIDLVPC